MLKFSFLWNLYNSIRFSSPENWWVFRFESRPIGLETADIIYHLIDIFAAAEFEWLFFFISFLYYFILSVWFCLGYISENIRTASIVGSSSFSYCFPHCLIYYHYQLGELWNVISFYVQGLLWGLGSGNFWEHMWVKWYIWAPNRILLSNDQKITLRNRLHIALRIPTIFCFHSSSDQGESYKCLKSS